MKLIQSLMALQEESSDLSRLPLDIIKAIKINVRKGAEDLKQQWPNALSLVHKAYSVEGVQRPDPSMSAAWEQYEQILQYAVQQLAKNRGMDADWRMSSSVFHEALQPLQKFKVTIGSDSFVVEQSSVDNLLNQLDVSVKNVNRSVIYDKLTEQYELTYSKWNIEYPSCTIQITPL